MPEVYYADKDTPKVKTSTEVISALSYQNGITNNKIRLYQNKFETTPTGQNLAEQQTDEKQKLIEQKIKLYEKIITQTKLDLINLQKEKDSGNNLTIAQIDAFMSLFSDNTPSKIYANTFEITKNQAKDILPKVEELLKDKNLTENYKTRLENVKNEIQIILKSNIKDTSLLTLTKNEILFMPEKIKLAAYGVKGEVVGIIDGAKNIITGFADLVVGIGKYAVYKKYREKINTQIGQIYDFCEKNGFTGMKDVVVNTINNEIDRISKLPKEKQAEEIGKIAGNVIAIIGTFKVGAMVSNKLKVIPVVGETGTLGEKIKTGTIITGLNTANVVINGPEEYLLKGAGKGIGIISDRISEGLSDITRFDFAESLLNRKLLDTEKIAIINAHNEPNLKEKVRILNEAKITKQERELLIRNYVCGGELKDLYISIELNKLKIVEKSYENITIEFINEIQNTKALENPNARKKIIEIWNNLKNYVENPPKNNADIEKNNNAIQNINSIIDSLKRGYKSNSPELNLLQKELGDNIELAYNKLKAEKNNIEKAKQRYNQNKEVIEKTERNELLFSDFIKDIEEFNGVKGKDKPKNPERLKEIIKIEIEKFEVWQNYRKERFGVSNELLEIANKKFFESVNSSLTFQLKKEVKFTNLKELNLFINKK